MNRLAMICPLLVRKLIYRENNVAWSNSTVIRCDTDSLNNQAVFSPTHGIRNMHTFQFQSLCNSFDREPLVTLTTNKAYHTATYFYLTFRDWTATRVFLCNFHNHFRADTERFAGLDDYMGFCPVITVNTFCSTRSGRF
ncbi:hypothetical protein [Pseudomonas phage Astolliot]|nr:hypothetical protein [Pseudomonas phage Astolliot]